ncbi:MAG TPA: zf-HC2 domain-containing protein, partial [Jatrophihabitans sp.]|nr:zf-HC2 domain-containing protein [Jatrophihabitans sp.]
MTCIMDNELGAYVLHALEPQEADAVRQHLTACHECRDEVRSLANTASLLAPLTLQDIEQLCDPEHAHDDESAVGTGERSATAPAQSAGADRDSGRPAAPRRRRAAVA